MVRARLLRLALAAGLGLAGGCSSTPDNGCSTVSNNNGLLSRLLRPFRHNNGDACEVVGAFPAPVVGAGPALDGPVVTDPGVCDGSGCVPVLPSGPVMDSAPVIPSTPVLPSTPVIPSTPVLPSAPLLESSPPPLAPAPRVLPPNGLAPTMPYQP